MQSINDKINLTPFQESILVLAALRGQIAKAAKTMVTKSYIEDEDLKFTINNYIQILLCSFLKEWKTLESMGHDSNIQATLKIASPALDRIRQWKGLPKVRSLLLAHEHRDKSGVPVLPWDVLDIYNAPTTYAETILLADCAHLAIDIVLDRHKSDYQQIVNQLNKMNRDIKDKGIRYVGEISTQFNEIKAEISRIAKKND